mmetsp:Transcript_25447/g.63853  ORF Transcript_25447/g.63853 Transcript_25447/m.63853 type:complete len:91 (+) Transcript_25447:682-954(+)
MSVCTSHTHTHTLVTQLQHKTRLLVLTSGGQSVWNLPSKARTRHAPTLAHLRTFEHTHTHTHTHVYTHTHIYVWQYSPQHDEFLFTFVVL